MLGARESSEFRLEFIEGPSNRVVRWYEVEAASAMEALSVACNDFNRVKAIYKASDFRVFDPRTQLITAAPTAASRMPDGSTGAPTSRFERS